ncbi:MAG: toll/interleukin-1 receptor domain-containing protein [Blastocatellia bacterium]
MSEDARANKIEVFISFANGDKRSYRQREIWERLTGCLNALRAEGVIQGCFSRAIDDSVLDVAAIERLKHSDIIIFALGQNYLDHPERYREVLKNLPESGRYLVFSLLLYPATWGDSPFIRFNLLPSNKAPVTESSDIGETFIEIKEAIRQARLAIYPDKPKPRFQAYQEEEVSSEITDFSEVFIDPIYLPVGSPESSGIFEDELGEERPGIIVPLPPPPIMGSPPAPVEPPSLSPPVEQELVEEKDSEVSSISFSINTPPAAPEPAEEKDSEVRQSGAGISSSILNRQELEFERKRIVTDAARKASLQPNTEAQKDIVDCTVFAPPSTPRNSVIFIQVYVRLQEQVEGGIRLASEFDSGGKRRVVKSLEEVVARGTRLSFELILPGLRGADPVQSIVWSGDPDVAQFAVEVPGDCPLGACIGSVIVSAHSIPIGHIKFKLQITELGSEAPVNEAVGEEAKRYNLAFISYASADRSKVLARAQMLDLVGIRYFQDVINLGLGDRWEKEIYRNIDSCDIFLLFWSKAARDSKWVLKEVRYARKRQPPPEIRPIVLEGPPTPTPPEDLSDLSFNDRFAYFILDQTP